MGNSKNERRLLISRCLLFAALGIASWAVVVYVIWLV